MSTRRGKNIEIPNNASTPTPRITNATPTPKLPPVAA